MVALLDIVLARRLVDADEVIGCVLRQPSTELHHLLAQAVDGLLVHVGLRNELRQGHYG